jgi:Na+/H+-dicarboxylate symporter
VSKLRPFQSNLTKHILLALLSGIVIGSILHFFRDHTWVDAYLTNGLFSLIGDIFITLMKMLVVPVVFVSIVCGASNLSDFKTLGRLGGKVVLFYLFTTAVAITLALIFSILFNIGQGADFSTDNLSYNAGKPATLSETILSLFPANPFNALAEGNVLALIIFALILGLAITSAGEPGQRIKNWFDDMNHVVMNLVGLVLKFAPLGVFALIAKFMIITEFNEIFYLISYFFTVVLVLLFHVVVTNSILLTLIGRMNPLFLFQKMFSTMLFAFSTASSNATIPLTLQTTRDQLGVDNRVCGFTIPLGATINMDGTAIMQGCATVFIANLYNIDIGIAGYLMVTMTATLSSIGTAGVPGIGMITLTMVLDQVGLPVEGIALIIGVDRLLDMLRTSVNVTGDATVTTVIAKTEKLMNPSTYAKMH